MWVRGRRWSRMTTGAGEVLEHKGYRDLNYNSAGLVPAVLQDARTGVVLMLAYMNAEALRRTLESGRAWFWSRSRQVYWMKGESSGNVLVVRAIYYDCDADTLLLKVIPQGAGVACHTGRYSCFYSPLAGWEPAVGEVRPEEAEAVGDRTGRILGELAEVIRSRRGADPESSYTARLLGAGRAAAARKVGEEALETVIAALEGSREGLAGEAADLLYHLLVLLEAADLPLEAVLAELARRRTAH